MRRVDAPAEIGYGGRMLPADLVEAFHQSDVSEPSVMASLYEAGIDPRRPRDHYFLTASPADNPFTTFGVELDIGDLDVHTALALFRDRLY